MRENQRLLTIDNVSRLFIIWANGVALFALWLRLEIVAREAQRARAVAEMAVEMHGRAVGTS